MKKGVTFIELVVVLAIIGILAAVTVPTIKNYLPSWQLSGSARLLVNKLRQAQEEVVTTQVQHGVKFFNPTAPPVTYELIKIGATEPLETITMPSNITVTGTDGAPLDETFSDNQVTFSADGGPSSSGNIVITLGDASKTINISPAGVIKFQ